MSLLIGGVVAYNSPRREGGLALGIIAPQSPDVRSDHARRPARAALGGSLRAGADAGCRDGAGDGRARAVVAVARVVRAARRGGADDQADRPAANQLWCRRRRLP